MRRVPHLFEQMLAAAMTEANRMLKANSDNFQALDSKALALCGLVLCGATGRSADVIDNYRAARKINRDAGVVKRVLELFDALAVARYRRRTRGTPGGSGGRRVITVRKMSLSSARGFVKPHPDLITHDEPRLPHENQRLGRFPPREGREPERCVPGLLGAFLLEGERH